MNALQSMMDNGYLAALTEAATPYQIGVVDAASGRFCLPELYSCSREFHAAYVAGFESVNGPTLLSLQARRLANKWPARLTVAEALAELEALLDGIDDEEWHRKGAW